MSEFKVRVSKFIQLIGRRNVALLILSAVVGLGWFATETFFVYIIQIFLAAIGLISPVQLGFVSKLPKGIGFACLIFFIFAVVRFVVTVSRNFLANWVQQSFVNHIRKQLFESALSGDVSLSSHDVLNLFGEVTTNSGLLVYNLSLLVVDVCAAVFFLAAAFYIAPFETCVGMAILGIAVFPLKYGARKIGSIGLNVHEEITKAHFELSTAIKNKFLLKLYGKVDTEVTRGQKTLNTYFDHHKLFGLWSGILAAMPVFVGVLSVIAVTYASAEYSQIKPMRLIAFLYIFLRLAQVGGEANTVFSCVRFFIPSLQALYDWLYRVRPIAEKKPEGHVQISEIKEIRFKNVDFSFGHRPILSQMSFDVKKGQCLAIVGPSGSGKSTLLSVLLGLVFPQDGEVAVDGKPIEMIHSSWRDRVAYVGPDPFAIEGTLRENLLYGNKKQNVKDAEIWNAIELVELKKELAEAPGGLEYYLKSASRFSSGQLQRLSIARALLRDFDILIFDEGTANLDSLTAQKILATIRELTKNKIFIRVTHQGVNPDLEEVIELRPLPRHLELTN